MTKEKPKVKKDEQHDALVSCKEELAAMSDNFLRLQAEFANYKRRMETLRENSFQDGFIDVLRKLVDVFDDFELALKNATQNDDFKKGIELVYAKLVSAGESYGMKKIQTVGEMFDATKHEALLTEESDLPSHTVIEELQSGFVVGDKVIRTAKVKCAK